MRAPTRLIAVARSALPAKVCSKKRNSSRLKTAALATINSVCEVTITVPKRKIAVVSGLVRKPSAPKNKRPSPDRPNVSATETMSRSKTEASAIGRNAMRSISGPIGATSAMASAICAGVRQAQARGEPRNCGGNERQYTVAEKAAHDASLLSAPEVVNESTRQATIAKQAIR